MASISGKPIAKRRHAAMQAALFNARKNRLVRVAGASGGGHGGGHSILQVSNYYNKQSLGSRGAYAAGNGNGTVTYTQNFDQTAGGHEYASWGAALDAVSNNGPVYTTNPVPGTTFVAFQFDEAFVCNGILFYGGDVASFGTWNIQGSNDGAAWTDLHTFAWTNVTNGANGFIQNSPTNLSGMEVTFTNTTKYSHYRMLNVTSPGSITNTFCNEIMFRSLHSELDGGNRLTSPLIITTRTALVDGDSHPNSFVDGDALPYASGAADSFFQNLTVGSSALGFQFPYAVIMRDCVVLQSQNNSQSDWGSWKWQRSDDGITWVDAGAPFVFQDATNFYQARRLPAPGGTVPAIYWRLLCTEGTRNNLSFFYEYIFNLT